VKHPTTFHLLRGNHEESATNWGYGFRDECLHRLGRSSGESMWRAINSAFNCLPVLAVVGRILCMHGGLSPQLSSLDDVRRIVRPTSIPSSGLLTDLVWADPRPRMAGWQPNRRRGASYVFGPDVVRKFLAKTGLEMVVRAHELVPEGYRFLDADRRLVTLFSAPDYVETGNAGAVMAVAKDGGGGDGLEYSFWATDGWEEGGEWEPVESY
jgi:serine/threonine-protein phosphatase PP1 catalytic subunit